MILYLIKLANKLDILGYKKESNFVDKLIKQAMKLDDIDPSLLYEQEEWNKGLHRSQKGYWDKVTSHLSPEQEDIEVEEVEEPIKIQEEEDDQSLWILWIMGEPMYAIRGKSNALSQMQNIKSAPESAGDYLFYGRAFAQSNYRGSIPGGSHDVEKYLDEEFGGTKDSHEERAKVVLSYSVGTSKLPISKNIDMDDTSIIEPNESVDENREVCLSFEEEQYLNENLENWIGEGEGQHAYLTDIVEPFEEKCKKLKEIFDKIRKSGKNPKTMPEWKNRIW